jgi:N-acyl-D-aspartate/D-glutamate deacylase
MARGMKQARDGTMHDLVIRRGLIVDGTGAPGRGGDLTIDYGVIIAVDGQAAWDNRS